MHGRDIQQGHTYVTVSGKVRRADRFEGPNGRKTVDWRDPSGSTGGRCDVEMFASSITREATPDEVRAVEQQRR
jgi:hypothetical protein